MEKLKLLVFILIILVVILFESCENAEPIVNIEHDKEHNWLSFNGNIEFYINEIHKDTTECLPELAIVIKTIDEYGCSNFPLIAEISTNNKIINIKIIGVDGNINICATAIGPARCREFLDIELGSYNLVFNYEGKHDTYKFEVTDSTVFVTEMTAQFSKPVYNYYRRFIPNTFSYGCSSIEETSWVCSDFIDSLFQQISIMKIDFPDSMVIPYYYGEDVFKYEKDSDFEIAGEYLKSYSKTRIDTLEEVYLHITSWKNKTYNSWE